MKAMLAWLGITGFSITLRDARKKLAALRSPNGEPIARHALGELYRDLERHQIEELEEAREERLQRKPAHGAKSTDLMLAQIVGIGIETVDQPGRMRCGLQTCATTER
jgi:hypothetical protein